MVTIELPEETAAALSAQAQAEGLDLATFLARIADRRKRDANGVPLSVEEILRRWREMMEWVATRDADRPSGSTVDDSRESIYDDRA